MALHYCILDKKQNIILGVGTSHMSTYNDAINNGSYAFDGMDNDWSFYPIRINKAFYERVLKYGGDIQFDIYKEALPPTNRELNRRTDWNRCKTLNS